MQHFCWESSDTKNLNNEFWTQTKAGFSNRFGIFLCCCLIFTLGLIMIFSTTSAEVLDLDLNKTMYQAVLKQMAYAGGGCILVFAVFKMDFQKLLQLTPQLLCFFTFLLILALIPGIGREVNGSRRWLGFGGVSFQPSEFVKYLVPMYFIHYLSKQGVSSLIFRQFLRLVGLVSIPMGLILIEPNNGTVAVIAATLTIVCFLMKVPFKYWALPLAIFAVVGGTFAYHLPYVAGRLKVYLNPELDLKGKGHQPYQAKIAAGSGGLFGKGPGNSWQKLSYLPEAQNDYIAAIYAEEFGYLGIVLLITLYMVLTFLGMTVAQQASTQVGAVLAGTVTFLITFQAFLNLGVVSGLLPSTGLNLPLFSQGGTSLIANMTGIALLLRIGSKNKQNA